MATIQHALLRGIETVFQLEKGEVLAEPMPTARARNGFLFYEATEGGAGVLTRLVAEPTLARRWRAWPCASCTSTSPSGPVAGGSERRTRLDRAGTECVAGCYRCLLSYYNQPDHDTARPAG